VSGKLVWAMIFHFYWNLTAQIRLLPDTTFSFMVLIFSVCVGMTLIIYGYRGDEAQSI
jgi:hypothetical protein